MVELAATDTNSASAPSTNRQIKWLVTFAAAWTAVLVTLVRLVP